MLHQLKYRHPLPKQSFIFQNLTPKQKNVPSRTYGNALTDRQKDIDYFSRKRNNNLKGDINIYPDFQSHLKNSKLFEEVSIGPWENYDQKVQQTNKNKVNKIEVKKIQTSFIKRNVVQSCKNSKTKKIGFKNEEREGQKFLNTIVYNYTLLKQENKIKKKNKKAQTNTNIFLLRRKNHQDKFIQPKQKNTYFEQIRHRFLYSKQKKNVQMLQKRNKIELDRKANNSPQLILHSDKKVNSERFKSLQI